MANFLDNLKNALASWAQKNPKVAQNVLKLEKPVQKVSSFLQQPYKPITLAPAKTQYKGLNLGINYIAKPIAESFINAPTRIIGGTTKTGLSIGRKVRGENVSMKEILGNVGEAGQGILDASIIPFGAGAVKTIAKGVAKETLAKAIGKGALSGAKYAGTYGALSGLSENKNQKNNLEYGKNLAKSTVTGLLTGGVAGGALGGLGYAGGKVFNKLVETYKKANPKATEIEASNAAKSYIRNEVGQFAKGEKPPEFIVDPQTKQFRKALGLPKDGMVISDMPMGLSVKPKGGNKSIQAAQDITDALRGGKINIDEARALGYKGKPIEVKKMVPSAELYSTKFKTTKTGQTVINDVLGDVPKKVVSHEEIKKATNIVNSETTKLLGDEQTKNMSAAFANLHNEINDLSKGGQVTPNIANKLKMAFEHRANAGRVLEGLKVAYENEGSKNPLMTQYIEKAAKQLGDIDKVLKAAKGVDFNNVEAANDFVRKFIKPKAEDWLTKLRYSSMLSSPNTWETNAESNLQGTGLIAPIEKTILGGIDWLSSSVTGKPRKNLVGEGVEYAKGYYNLGNLKDAFNKFRNIMKTGRASEVNKYEIGAIPLTKAGTVGRTVENIMDTPGRILLATDAFFRHLTSKGVEKSINYRQSKGVGAISDIIGTASTEARERLFNEELKTGSGGYVSKAIGLLGDKVNSLRSNKNPIIRYIANFTLPFVKIPTNIMRTSIQYSPFGIADIIGSSNKQASLAKIVLGTGVAMGTGLLASSDKITAGLPKSEKLRKAWKEANIQPWSIKVGDNWYSYQNLHPAIGFNMALASYFKSNYQEIPNSQAEKVLGIFGVAANKIFAQSYTKNIADLFDAINGDTTALSKMASNYPSQLIPFRAFQGWLNRAFDPKIRNTDPEGTGLARQLDGILKQVQNNIVGMSGNLPARTNAYGEELQNPIGNRAWNALSSVRTTTENPQGMEVFKNMLQNKNTDKQKQLDIQGIINNTQPSNLPTTQATGQTTGDTGLDLIIKQETEKARIKTITDILTRKGDYKDVPLGETQTQRLLQMEKVQPQEIEQAKIKAISSLGTKETVDYIKSQPNVDFTSLYKQGALTSAVAKEMERQGYITDADALMKKLQMTDVYYQNKAARATVKKLSKLKVKTMKSILKSQKTKTIKIPKSSIMKVKPVKLRKMPKIKKVKSYKSSVKRLTL